jgi:hypothetical protein
MRKRSNFAFHNLKDKNEQNSDFSTNVNLLNNLNNNNNINKSINSKVKLGINQNIINGNIDENRNKNSVRKSFKESPQIFSKRKTQFNGDKDETFSNIINFVNQDLKKGSFGQINPLNNFVYKINSGNTYSSIHKNNISYNSSKNQNGYKNVNRRNSFSKRKIISSSSIFYIITET